MLRYLVHVVGGDFIEQVTETSSVDATNGLGKGKSKVKDRSE